MKSVFIDGQVGTTGLQIHERLKHRADIEIVSIENEYRKDIARKKEIINSVDLAILCLPDAAAKESVALIENETTRVVDASTAHRINPRWAYGFPELSAAQRDKIASAQFVSNPGCHATGFIAAIAPLINEGVAPKDYPYSVTSITGYSGGGRQLIERYVDAPDAGSPSLAARPYGFALTHKHLPEMKTITGLDYNPSFYPVVADFERGMLVSVGLETRLLNKVISAEDIHSILKEHYADQQFVKVIEYGDNEYLDAGFLDATTCNDTNNLELFVFGHKDQAMLVARFDNLGKGASGAAVQNMNIMLGLDEATGLV